MSAVAVSPFDIRSKVNIFGTISGCRMKRFPLRGALPEVWLRRRLRKFRNMIECQLNLPWPVAQANFFYGQGHPQVTGRVIDLLTFQDTFNRSKNSIEI